MRDEDRAGDGVETSEAGASAADEGENAPTSAEENEGMSTVLSADPLAGVQKDASEE